MIEASLRFDTVTYCATIPDIPDPEVKRGNLVDLLKGMLKKETRVVIVQGELGSGRTTLLAQFARIQKTNCFSFFIGSSQIKSDPRAFLLEMCEQMCAYVGLDTDQLSGLTIDQLETRYLDLQRKVSQHAKHLKEICYYVIDGLEWLKNNNSPIFNLLPTEPLSHSALLLSSDIRTFSFSHETWHILSFSETETASYLNNLDLNGFEIDRISHSSAGVPGYLSVVKRLLSSGVLIEDLPHRVGGALSDLFDFEWERIDNTDEYWMLLAVIAFSQQSLSTSELSQILNRSEYDVIRILENLAFVNIGKTTGIITFRPDVYGEYVAKRTSSLKHQAETLLIDYYLADPYRQDSLLLLPEYMVQSSSYAKLKDLVTREYLEKGLQSSKDIATIRRTLYLCINQALSAEDWNAIGQYSLENITLGAMAAKSVDGDEVSALLSLKKYDKAIHIASGAVLFEDRLELYGRIAAHMHRSELDIPDFLLQELEGMSDTYKNPSSRKRAITIAAVIFSVLPEHSVHIIERTVAPSAGKQALDLARAELAFMVRTQDNGTITSRIDDPDIRDFARRSSPWLSRRSAGDIIKDTSDLHTPASQLSQLGSWCNSNKSDPNSIEVVKYALSIISENPDYAPPISLMRQFAESLRTNDSPATRETKIRIEEVFRSLVRSPEDEAIKLDLTLAAIESRYDANIAIDRLTEIYFALDELNNLDIVCSGLISIGRELSAVDQLNALQLESEIKKRISDSFEELLSNSAEQSLASRPLLRSLVAYDRILALHLAMKLNTASRRDDAIRQLLWSYLELQDPTIDMQFIGDAMKYIIEPIRAEVTLVGILERVSTRKLFVTYLPSRALLSEIDSIRIPINHSFARAFIIGSLDPIKDANLIVDNSNKLKLKLEEIDQGWERARIRLKIASLIADNAPLFAQELIDEFESGKHDSPLLHDGFADSFISCLKITIRTSVASNISDVSHLDDELMRLIRWIPSFSVQCNLFSSLALRRLLDNDRASFDHLVENVILPLLNGCNDHGAYLDSIRGASIAIFEYDEQLFNSRIKDLPSFLRNTVLYGVILYIVSGIHPDEIDEQEEFSTPIEARPARRAIALLNHINSDSTLYSSIHTIVCAIVRPHSKQMNREICKRIIDRDALEICRTRENIVKEKLPSKLGIQHQGYVIACNAQIERLRSAASNRQPTTEVWERLAVEANRIPNAADRAFVFGLIADACHIIHSNLSENLLQKAYDSLELISTDYDKAVRSYYIAEYCSHIKKNDFVKKLLEDTIQKAQLTEDGGQRDWLLSKAIQLAQTIDANFASSLTASIQNPIMEHKTRLELATGEMQKNPDRIQSTSIKYDLHNLDDQGAAFTAMARAAERISKALNSGTGAGVRHSRQPGEWLVKASKAPVADALPIFDWFINNYNRGVTIDGKRKSYDSLIYGLGSSIAVAQTLLGIHNFTISQDPQAIPTDLSLFQAGNKSSAANLLQDWIVHNAFGYLKVYDPYFTPGDMTVLSQVPIDCSIYIFTSWKVQEHTVVGDRNVAANFQITYKHLFPSEGPSVQVTIIGTKSGLTPIHNRYIISQDSGLSISTSFNSVGSKDTDFQALDEGKRKAIEQNFIDPLLTPQIRMFQEEEVIRRTFILESD